MKELFYIIVEAITEYITGLENGAVKVWELARYLEVSIKVATLMNALIACVIVLVIATIVLIGRDIYTHRRGVRAC